MPVCEPDRGLPRSIGRSFSDRVGALDFKAAARLVLEEVGHPLHYTDITELALESGYLTSRGRTPHNTMRARLSVDVRDNPESLFVQTAPGVYGLKGRIS
ncbi:MAG TPA: winged helix-turn-helix domain-containing protein [Rubrobacteraceae bacterium]|nr:winged helix-turn-helix domain-containing protein [Rubrobacteraceae bacterium]